MLTIHKCVFVIVQCVASHCYSVTKQDVFTLSLEMQKELQKVLSAFHSFNLCTF